MTESYSRTLTQEDTPTSISRKIRAFETLYGPCEAYIVGSVAVEITGGESKLHSEIRLKIERVGSVYVYGSCVWRGKEYGHVRAYTPSAAFHYQNTTYPDLQIFTRNDAS